MKVLIVGSGAREHALGWKIAQSPLVDQIYFAPGNWGTALLGQNINIPTSDIVQLANWASTNQIDLTIVGPENPLMDGISVLFANRNLSLLGPSREGARLEGSKIWAKNFFRKHQIPTATSNEFDSIESARKYLRQQSFPVVVKADGLAQGKGVVICQNFLEGESALLEFMVNKSLGSAGEKILIESFLEGEEVSAFALCDGERFCYMGDARDYKRAHDRDEGPNTGGMGAISSEFLLSENIRQEICDKIFTPTLAGLAKEGIGYRGILYAGLMLTDEGPKVLEFNVRWGDPEAQVILPRIQHDVLPLFMSAAEGDLISEQVILTQGAALGVVVATHGYPGKYERGNALPDLQLLPKDLLVFHALTSNENGNVVNQGGRTLTVVARDTALSQARKRVYAALSEHDWNGFFYRSDIGLKNIEYRVGDLRA